jgi:hypothetical protein
MENKPEQLDELFKLPIGLKPVAKLDGKTLYGSEDLTNSFIEAIKSTSVGNQIDVFEKLIRNKKVIPCFHTGGLTSFIFWKIFAPVHLKCIVGFYHSEIKKVYILLSNNYNFFAYTSNEWLSKLLIHECVHMSSHLKPTMFINYFKDPLTKYYKNYLQRLFQKDFKEEDILKYINFIYTYEVGKNTNLKAYRELLFDIAGSNNEEKIKKIVVGIYLYVEKQEEFFRLKEQLSEVLAPLYFAYRDGLNIKNLSTICIQELFAPSEVIAIASEYSQYSKFVIPFLRDL